MRHGHTPPPGHQSPPRRSPESMAYRPRPRTLRDLWRTPIGYVLVRVSGGRLQVQPHVPDEEMP